VRFRGVGGLGGGAGGVFVPCVGGLNVGGLIRLPGDGCRGGVFGLVPFIRKK